MKESEALLEIRKIRDENAKKTKDMTLKEKIDYLFAKGEQARKNLNLKPRKEHSNYPLSQNQLSNTMVLEKTEEYNDKDIN